MKQAVYVALIESYLSDRNQHVSVNGKIAYKLVVGLLSMVDLRVPFWARCFLFII